MAGHYGLRMGVAALALANAALAPWSAAALASPAPPPPASLLPPAAGLPAPTPSPDGTLNPDGSQTSVVQPVPGETVPNQTGGTPTAAAIPLPEPVMTWTADDAAALLQYIGTVASEGLIPADYQPDQLRAAIDAVKAGGPGSDLDAQASRSFDWLVEDLRDGRTPMAARQEWFAVDPDADLMPTATVLAKALATHDIAGTLTALDPVNGEFAALKDALATTPVDAQEQRDLIRVNMDRWRWLPRELGMIYLIVNVPEFQVRLVANHQVIRTYRTIVGRPGRTATPQLAETVKAVVFNPTWTVPQSIIQHEPHFAALAANPAMARREGYVVTTSDSGAVTLVQQPGPKNSLGLMKIDMPNPHAIYLHDTPSRSLFDRPVRAFSHGCIRTEKAVELGMTMAMLGANMTPAEAIEKTNSHKYARVAMSRTFPVYINYSTYGRDPQGQLTRFNDLYGRDAPVLASLAAPRQMHTTQRVSSEPIIKAEDPL
ncbi:MAG: L,D-transpeptidase family protein [Pseudomonadota bacterium]|nr:L,D-transpeptidase family protein [Pseudomonadota bacterium]